MRNLQRILLIALQATISILTRKLAVQRKICKTSSLSSATTHNSRKGKSKSSSKQPTVKRSKRQQSFFAGKAYLKINSLVKTPLHEFIAAARSEILKVCTREEKLRRRRRSKFKGSGCVLHQKMFKFRVSEISSPVFSVNINEKKCSK